MDHRRAFDEFFLGPLGLTRDDVWLCDLVPYSCMNDQQADALAREYGPRMDNLELPIVCWGAVPVELADENRQTEIECEINAAQPWPMAGSKRTATA